MQKKKNIEQFKEQKAFKVPENYFENFALNMQHQIVEQKEELGLWQRLFSANTLKLFVPSLIIMILCFSIYFIIPKQNTQAFINLKDIENYILEESDYAIIDDYEDILASNLEIEPPVLLEEDIIDYLIDEDIDIELITQ